MDIIKKYTPHVLALSLAMPLFSYMMTSQNVALQFPVKLAPNLAKKEPTHPVDVLIIGGGPTGLSAAMTLYRHQHDMRIFDYGKPRNAWDTNIHALPGWEGEKPRNFVEKSKRALKRTGFVDFISTEVQTIEKGDDGLFYAKTTDGTEWAGRKVLLAMGVQFQFLDIPGYKDNFPKRMLVSTCTYFGIKLTLALVFIASSHSGLSIEEARLQEYSQWVLPATPSTQISW
jgi:hypothetical protein